MNKFLIAFAALICAAQASSIPYGGYNAPVHAGKAWQLQPALTLQVLPSHSYGSPNYGVPRYNAHSYDVPSYGAYSGPVTIPIYTNPGRSYAPAIDGEVLGLAKTALALPSAGGPIASSYAPHSYGVKPVY